jgi:metal-responsive CopG/Arc/MetJ family transcriptional regulator
MNKRINVILPEATVAVLDRVAPKGNRSAVIDRAVHYYINSHSKRNLRELLKAEAQVNAHRDFEMAAEWFPLEEEAWQKTLGRKRTKAS